MTYFQRRTADRESGGGEKADISKQQQKWWSTFQILEKNNPQHLNWEIINGQLDGDNQVRRSPANSMQKKFKPIYEPCQDTERVSPCWHGRYFPGTGPEPLHSFSQQLFSWNSAEYFFPSFFFFLTPQQKSM